MNDDNKPLPMEDDYEPDLLTLEDEAGVEHTFEVLDATDIDGERYMAMATYNPDPAAALEEDAEMLIMKLSMDGDEEVLDLVEDEDELMTATQVFLTRLSELYDIDLDELAAQLQDENGQKH